MKHLDWIRIAKISDPFNTSKYIFKPQWVGERPARSIANPTVLLT